MRILTLRQPYAQLTVRGVRPFDARSWIANESSGRIAIHAAKHADTADDLYDAAQRDSHLLHYLADFRWHTKEALRELPRRAIVGTVTLKRVVRAKYLRKAPHMVGTLTGEEWVWEFEDAVEIEPISLEHGPMKLGTLDDATACAVAEAEQKTRAAGVTFKVSPLPDSYEGRLAAARRGGYEEDFLDRMEDCKRIDEKKGYVEPPDLKSDEELEAERSAEELVDRACEERFIFKQPVDETLAKLYVEKNIERTFRRGMTLYFRTHELRLVNGASLIWVDRRCGELVRMFGEQEWAAREQFEERSGWELVRRTDVPFYEMW
jgi:hypothetical protein